MASKTINVKNQGFHICLWNDKISRKPLLTAFEGCIELFSTHRWAYFSEEWWQMSTAKASKQQCQLPVDCQNPGMSEKRKYVIYYLQGGFEIKVGWNNMYDKHHGDLRKGNIL